MYFEDPEHYEVSLDDMKELTQLFNRGGFTEGYYTSRGGLDMMSVERPKTWGLKVGIVDKYLPQHKKSLSVPENLWFPVMVSRFGPVAVHM